MFSTISDISRAGNAILGSSLLSPARTRRWLKPVAQTSNLVNTVGRPWEIYAGATHLTDPVVPVYTKVGNIGLYSSYLGLLPDYDVVDVILAADTQSSADLNTHADKIGEVFLPPLVQMAGEQAQAAYAGVYRSSDVTMNSSITIEATDGEPGMSVAAWTSNGTNFRAVLATLNHIDPAALSLRLYPTNLRSASGSGSKIAFRAVLQDQNAPADAGTPTCITWMGVETLVYGSVALDEFVFDLGEHGQAEGVEIPALRTTLRKMV